MRKNNFLATVLATVLTSTLAACGGSDGEASPTETDVEKSAVETVLETDIEIIPTGTIEDEFSFWLSDLTKNHILPSYQNLEDNTQVLAEQSNRFCALVAQTDADLTLVQNAWRAASVSWETIQWIKVGPILEDFRSFRLQFWPDSNNAVSTSLASLLVQTETVTETLLAGSTVGGQGFPALELLLFNDGSDESLLTAENKSKRCEVLQAISANVATISTEVNSEWQANKGNYQAQLIDGTGDFTSKTDAVEELITNWLEQLELVKDEKMLAPLGDKIPGLPSLSEQSLSDESISSIKANIATFRIIYTAGHGHGFDDILIDFLDQKNINTEMLAAIDASIDAADTLNSTYKDLLSTEAGRTQLNTTIQNLRLLRDLLTADFVQTTDINIGFNSNDGD